jgi:hypothetical protein
VLLQGPSGFRLLRFFRVYICAYLRILASNTSVLMAESVEGELEVLRTDDEHVKKPLNLMYQVFDKFDPSDPAQVASRLAREQRELEPYLLL